MSEQYRVWTPKRIEDYAQRSADARSRLQRLIENGTVRPADHNAAWGQFLDAPRDAEQYGIYGTAAAMQLLNAAGVDEQSSYFLETFAWLPETGIITNGPTQVDPSDLSLIIKCSAILAASQPGHPQFSEVQPIESRLRSYILQNRGWGTYYFTNGQQDPATRLLPTAHALLALARSRDFSQSPECEAILVALASSVRNQHELPAHELAMAGLALQAFPNAGATAAGYADALASIETRLLTWVRAQNDRPNLHSTSYHYTEPADSGSEHNHYMFYLPDVLATKFLLQQTSVPGEARHFLLTVVQYVVDNVQRNNGFKTEASNRLATVDQTEVYLLLQTFEKIAATPYDVLPALARIAGSTLGRRLLSSIVLLLVGIAAGYIGIAEEDFGLLARSMAAAVAALSIGTLGALLLTWLRLM